MFYKIMLMYFCCLVDRKLHTKLCSYHDRSSSEMNHTIAHLANKPKILFVDNALILISLVLSIQ
jgi:hypothetical protein